MSEASGYARLAAFGNFYAQFGSKDSKAESHTGTAPFERVTTEVGSCIEWEGRRTKRLICGFGNLAGIRAGFSSEFVVLDCEIQGVSRHFYFSAHQTVLTHLIQVHRSLPDSKFVHTFLFSHVFLY